MTREPMALGLYKDGLLLLSELLGKLFHRVGEFDWYSFSTNMYFGESKSPCAEWYGTQFHYIVGICYDENKNEYQFIISHDKYFVNNHQFLMQINHDMPEFELLKKLYEHLGTLGVKRVFHDLPHSVLEEWQGPVQGLNSFLTHIPDIK